MSHELRVGIYPGTFDPITYGHLDIINRALSVVDILIVGIALENTKFPIFSPEERIEMINHEIKTLNHASDRIKVACFGGLLADFAREMNASLIIRGLRAVSDFEFEFQLSCMNAKLAPEIKTVFLPTSEKTHFISSRLVKEVARLKGDVSDCVSDFVKTKLYDYFFKNK